MREADCRLRAIPVFLQTMIEKRDSFACTISTFSQGLKPTGISNASRGAEAPLFHGTSGFRRALRFCSAPTFYGFRHSRGIRGFRNASPVRIFSFILLVLVLVLVLALSVMAQAQTEKYPQTIVFMTDFGVVDDSVALCKGVMYSIMPQVRIVDLTHEVTPFSILDGARFLYGATPYFPAGTVFVVVIDPTVGSTRKAIVAKSKRGQYFVLPDNGLLTLVEQRDGIESRA